MQNMYFNAQFLTGTVHVWDIFLRTLEIYLQTPCEAPLIRFSLFSRCFLNCSSFFL